MTDESCSCAPCCKCGYDGQDSDGADCPGDKRQGAGKPGMGPKGAYHFGPHCFCWTASEMDCEVHGKGYGPMDFEVLDDMEPCPNMPIVRQAVEQEES